MRQCGRSKRKTNYINLKHVDDTTLSKKLYYHVHKYLEGRGTDEINKTRLEHIENKRLEEEMSQAMVDVEQKFERSSCR